MIASQSVKGSIRNAGRLALTNASLVHFYGANPNLVRFRRTLAIYQHRGEILRTLNDHQVALIIGDSGCGKTTQIPQYILEEAHDKKTPVRIVSIQPRRLLAMTAAERVKAELGIAYF